MLLVGRLWVGRLSEEKLLLSKRIIKTVIKRVFRSHRFVTGGFTLFNFFFSESSHLDPQDFSGSCGIERAGISVRRYPPEPRFLSLAQSHSFPHSRSLP